MRINAIDCVIKNSYKNSPKTLKNEVEVPVETEEEKEALQVHYVQFNGYLAKKLPKDKLPENITKFIKCENDKLFAERYLERSHSETKYEDLIKEFEKIEERALKTNDPLQADLVRSAARINILECLILHA